MVERFLRWRLPADFNPDGGISFEPMGLGQLNPLNTTGTNLFDVNQAEAMVRFMIDEMGA
jgi:hypothetical protein